MGPSFFLSKRYFSSRKGYLFVSFLTAVSMASVALSVFSIIVVLSVMRGFNTDLEAKLKGLSADIMVSTIDASDGFDDVRAYLASELNVERDLETIEGEVVIGDVSEDNTYTTAARVKGVRNDVFGSMPLLTWYWGVDGSEDEFAKGGGLILGADLSYDLGVHPDFCKGIRLIAPLAKVSPTGDLMPETMTLPFLGTFKSGFFEADSMVAFVPYDKAAFLLGEQGRKYLYIWVLDGVNVTKLRSELIAKFGDRYKFDTWQTQNSTLFSALRLERIAMSAILGIASLVASFSIVSVLSMLAHAKKKDVAVLMACGAKRTLILKTFALVGLFIGVVGIAIGTTAGILAVIEIGRGHIPLPESYYLGYLPAKVEPVTIVIIVLVAMLLTLLSALYPAWQVSRTAPAHTLRSE